MIKQYLTTEAEQLHQLVWNVNEYIKDGWQPLGAPFQVKRPNIDALTFVQAMVREED